MMSDTPEQLDLDRIEAGLDAINQAADRASGAIAGAFSRGIAQGKDFESILRGLGQRLIDIGLQAAFKPLESSMSGFLSSLTSGLTSVFQGASAGLPLNITPFAEGGVISAPQFFPMGRGLGLAGERGAEAILPLARGPDGRLGVASGGGRSATTVNVTIVAQDLDSFRRSETQIAAAMTRALSRGQRAL
jgi:phage-related minor tail protein